MMRRRLKYGLLLAGIILEVIVLLETFTAVGV